MNNFLKYYFKNNSLTLRKMYEIESLYRLDKNKLLEKYNLAFLSLLKYAFKNSLFYKNLYHQHGINITDIKDLSDIKKLPVIKREDIQNQKDKIFHGIKLFKTDGYTSGTTGSPLTICRTPQSIITEQAYIRQFRAMHGYKLGQPLLSIRGTLDRNTSYKFFKQANTLCICSPNINAGTIEFYHKLIKEFAPVAVEAFPSYLAKITQEMINKNLEWQVPIAFTSSETLYDFEREKIETFLKTNIYDWYGNSERSILLAQDKNKKYIPLPLYSINEYQEGEVITTALNNKNFPFIRYTVEDKIVVKGTDLLQNIIAPDIDHVEGRAADTIDLKDGSVVGCIDHAFKGINHLQYAQVHQYNVNKPIEVKMVVTDDFGNDDLSFFKSKFVKMIGKEMQYFITYCKWDDLTFFSNNKFKLIIKNCKPRK